MSPITEPADLTECECNAQGLYALPEAVFARVLSPDNPPRPSVDEPGVQSWSIDRLFRLGGLNAA